MMSRTNRRDEDWADIDLDTEEVFTESGDRFTNADAEALADELETQPPGRPSLSGRGSGVSPTVAFRVARSTDARLRAVAELEGRRPTDVARAALEEYLEQHLEESPM